MYAHEDLTNTVDNLKLERKGLAENHDLGGGLLVECGVYEATPGLGRYLEVKRILEAKYDRKISHEDMGRIFSAVLKEMPHEKRVKKKYGDGKYYWRTREFNLLKDAGKV